LDERNGKDRKIILEGFMEQRFEKGYYLHIEGCIEDAIYYRFKNDLMNDIKEMVREYNNSSKRRNSDDRKTIKDILEIAYIIPCKEYNSLCKF
jgi:hypothetical protein